VVSTTVRTLKQAARYIDHVGFCLLFPIKGLRLPSLWAAVKGRVPVPSPGEGPKNFNLVAAWDDDAMKLWEWKDELPRRRLAFSGKVFRGKQSLLSLEFLPCFYCLAENYAAPKGYEPLYREGKLSPAARAICAELYRHGPQATLALRHALGFASARQNRRFKRALEELQRRLLIVHWGVEAETRGWESVVYQLTPRAFPRAVRAAASLSRAEARDRIVGNYRRLLPGATPADAARLFGWPLADARAAFAARNSVTL
jgi:hypothetical protein